MLRITPLLFVPVLLLIACDSVVSVHKLGAAAPDEKAERFEGVWHNDEGTVTVRHVGGGELAVAGLKWDDDARAFEMQQVRAWVTTHHDTLYLNMVLDVQEEAQAADGPPTYQFFRCTIDDRNLLLYPARPRYYARAIEAQQIVGTVTRGEHNTVHAVIEGDAEAWLKHMDPDRVGEQFDIDQPMILRRVSTGS